MFERHPWRGGSEVWRKLGGVDKVAKKKGGKGVLYFSGCVLWRRKSQEMRYGYKNYARMSDLIFSSCECLLRNKRKGVQYRQKYTMEESGVSSDTNTALQTPLLSVLEKENDVDSTRTLPKTGKQIRRRIFKAAWPQALVVLCRMCK